MIDELESTLRRVVADEIGDFMSRAAQDGRQVPDEVDQKQMAIAILQRELDSRSRAALRHGDLQLTADEEDRITRTVLETAFSAAPFLDRFLKRDDVTDVFINGCDDVRLGLLNGEVEQADPVARSDEELIEMLQTVARRGGHMEREFTPNRPTLDLQLPDGSRLTAIAWTSKRPYASIRRHLFVDADQTELVRRRMYDQGLATFFRACVRTRKNTLIAGGQGAGKTTLLRAFAHEFDPDERVIVLEQEPELHLDRNPRRHNHVLSLMERQANTEGAGAVVLADLARAIKRLTPRRIIVGEVRGPEVIDMLEAMTQGISGSMCTIHADSSFSVFPRLPVYARASGRDWSTGDILQLAALALDFVVFVTKTPDGRRVVAEVRYVQGYDHSSGQIITDELFVPGPDGCAVRNPLAPIPVQLFDELVRHGYNPSLHESGF
jgi:pilus assembly protein CpaF